MGYDGCCKTAKSPRLSSRTSTTSCPNFEKKRQMHNKVKPFVPHQYALAQSTLHLPTRKREWRMKPSKPS
ncbi:hypothetical protein GQ600_7284 [Phytophthora cactorum]|nr:hypothetical protein GQ600_7284 [Phytophthora cactorum]